MPEFMDDVDGAARAAVGLVATLRESVRSGLSERIDELARRVEALEENAPLADARPAGDLRETVQQAITALLVESGLLERLVGRIVERKLEELSAAGAPSDAAQLRKEAARLTKEFLAENLGQIFRNEIQGVVRRQIAEAFGSEEMKTLMDDKFRTVSIYLKTEVIPKAVRQAVQEVSQV